MPGIAGLITDRPREWAEPRVSTMLDAMRHGASFESGAWADTELGVYAGWTKRRGAAPVAQPVWNEREDLGLIFSGEEFSAEATADSPGYLVHLAGDGTGFPGNCNGRFHGILLNRRDRSGLLFNDRYGIHRLYWHESAGAMYFAAEAKAILAVCPELRELDPASLGEYVACGCVLENRTLFRGVGVVPGAAAWTFRNGKITGKKQYFHPREWEMQEPLDPETSYRNLRDVFSRRLPAYFGGYERVGMSLTGGLDTRMILAWHRRPGGSLPCYSFGSMFHQSQDVSVGRRVADACGQPHSVIRVDGEFLSRFQHYAERSIYLTDGCVDVSHSPDLFANERAARIAPVRMTGNYGGEVLRCIRPLKAAAPPGGLFHADFLRQVRAAQEAYRGALDCHPVSFAVFRQLPWHHYGLLALEESQLSLRSPYLDNEVVKAAYRLPDCARSSQELSLRLIGDGDPGLGRIRTDRGLNGHGSRLFSAVRHRFFEFTFKAEYASDYGMPQPLARLDGLLSALSPARLFLGRHKFYHFRVWYRDALAGYIREMLLDRRALGRPYVVKSALESMVEEHTAGKRNHTRAIHKMLSLELIQRLFIDRRP